MDTVLRKRFTKLLILIFSIFITLNFNTKVKADSEIILAFSDSSIKETVSGSGYIINGTSLEITKAGTYRIKGSCSEGNISVKKGTTGVLLILDDLSLTSSTTAPIVIKKEGTSATIKLVGDNTLIDNEDPENEFSQDPDIADAYEGAAIKVKNGSSLTIEGAGRLNIEGRANNGIKGGAGSSITVNTGEIIIGAANHGLACDGSITLNNGMITIDAHNEGIKLEPDEGDVTSLAKLTINGGKTVIRAGGDGIQATGDIEVNGWSIIEINSGSDGIQTKSNFTMTNGTIDIFTFEGHSTLNFDKDAMSAKGIKASKTDEEEEFATNTINITGGTITIDSSDDAIHSDGYINITRGTIDIESGDDGIHADTRLVIGTANGLERDPEINVNDAIEGIEAGNIYIYSGKVKVNALDDGINAAGGASSGGGHEHGEHFNPDTGQMEDNYAIYVYGGNMFVTCEGDGLDANGSIYLYGGTQIIYHQDAQGNNSALDRDHNLIIDGATVFSAGGVADNGHVDSTGSSQQIIIDETTNYVANSLVKVEDNGTVVFNDEIPKRSTYTFYSSPTLTSNSNISNASALDDDVSNPWKHTWNDGVVVTPATPSTPGVMSYTCAHGGTIERKTYFYRGEVEFTFVNKTNGQVSVEMAGTTKTVDFTTTDVDEDIYITTTKDLDVLVTYDDISFESLSGTETTTPNRYKYHVNPNVSKKFYIIYDGDVNMDGITDVDDSTLIAKSLVSPRDERFVEFTNIQRIVADTNDDGLTNSHDGLSILKNLTGTNVYDESNFAITSIDPVVLDGEHDGEATVSFYTTKAITIDAMDGRYSPSQDNPSTNGYLELTDIQGSLTAEYAVVDVKNGFAGAVDTNGLIIPANTTLVTLKYKVDKDTPTGTYPVKLRIDSVTAHNSSLDATFELTADVIVKGTTDPTTAFFSADSGVAGVDVYYTQNYTTPNEIDVSSTVIRNPDTGEIIPTGGEGQLNFSVKTKLGYIVNDITVVPSSNFKQIKGPADTENANTYRVTKVTGDIEVIITTKQATEYTINFDKGSHVNSIDVYYTQDYTVPDELDVNSAYARNGDTGAVDITGDGQVNFKVNLDSGYKVKDIKITGLYKNLKEQTNRIYRVTKINGDLLIKVTAEAREEVAPTVSGYENSYVYTGSKIKPNVTVKIPDPQSGEDIVLVKDTDYKVTYGDNKNVGNDEGTITVTSIDSSNYMFDPITINFDITPYQLKASNVSAPASIVYTGSTLDPTVTVNANGSTLVEDTDYDISFTNLDGGVGEQISVTITGKGNYTGTVDTIKINITDKANQVIQFDTDEITKVYGDDFTKTATLVVGDGTIRYTSNNTQAAIVDENTGAVTLIGTGQATIRAFASETATYAEAVTSYKLIVKKADITIDNVTISDKPYDGTKDATVTGVTFGGLVKDETLVEGTDYTVTAEFDNKEVGADKDVTVTVDLSSEVIKRYSLSVNTYVGKASITRGVITESGITLSKDTYVYNGTPKKPDVTVMVGDITLVEGVDYLIEYVDNVEAGTAKVVVTGIGNYATDVPVEKTFTINKKNIVPEIEAIDDVTYDGNTKEPSVKVKYKDVELVEGRDYTVTYTDNTDAGTAKVNISPVAGSSYTFDDTIPEAESTFTIKPYTITKDNIELEYNTVKYDGNYKEPSVTVTANGTVLVKDTDYTVTYSNNRDIGTNAKVHVVAISNNYDGDVDLFFEISNKDGLKISGIEKQKVTYTGSPVVLNGTLTVSENNDGITADDLDVTYYDDQDNEISRPTNVGSYYVIYSYDGPNYKGQLKVEFEITKADSGVPAEMTANLQGVKGDELSTITLTTQGLTWDDDNTKIKNGTNSYPATYIKNNDSTNYNPSKINIPVTGKVKTDIVATVDGTGGTVTGSATDVLEGTQVTLTITPNPGFELDYVTVNNEDATVTNNQLTLVASTKDKDVVIKFKPIVYSLNVSSKNTEVSDTGIIDVDYEDSKTITINSKFGYRLSSVKVDGVEMIDTLTANTLVLTNITSDTDVDVESEKIIYEVIEGARQEYIINKNTEGRFKINAEYSVFIPDGEVYVDEKLVNSSEYTSEEGSTVITFKKSFMDKLQVGAHSLHVVFNDGGMASCTFKVSKISKVSVNKASGGNIVNPSAGKNPNTGDNIYIIVLTLVISLITILVIRKKKMLK